MKNKTIPIVIIVLGVLIAGVIIYNNYIKSSVEEESVEEEVKVLSLEEAGQRVISFIDENILQGQTPISLIETLEEDGLYKVRFKVEEEEVEWRITKNGKLIFPQVIDLTEIETEPEPEQGQGSSLENFAKCLSEKGMKFYGASSCGWCAKEKELFAEAVEYLPYVECVDEESGELITECQEAGISGFPTWKFPNGELVSGFKTLEELSELSGCSIE